MVQADMTHITIDSSANAYVRCVQVMDAYMEPLREMGKANQANRQQQVDTPVNVAKELASIAGVSHGTFYQAKRIYEKAPRHVQGMVRRGEWSINKAYRAMNKRNCLVDEVAEFHPIVAYAMEDNFDRYEHHYRLDNGKVVDFVAWGWGEVHVVECKLWLYGNDAYAAAGQALYYKKMLDAQTAFVLVPEGQFDESAVEICYALGIAIGYVTSGGIMKPAHDLYQLIAQWEALKNAR